MMICLIQVYGQNPYDCSYIESLPGDFTVNLQNTINNAPDYTTITFDGSPGKEYIMGPITVPSNRNILFEEGIILTAKSNIGATPIPFPDYTNFFSLNNISNVTIIGDANNKARIRMNITEYSESSEDPADNEHRHLISLAGCNNIEIKNLILERSGGDGIYLGEGGNASLPDPCVHIVIENVECIANARNGIGIISADDVTVTKCLLKDSGRENGYPGVLWNLSNADLLHPGGDPGYGIDFEPNNYFETFQNIIVTDCKFENNNGAPFGFQFQNYTDSSPEISIEIVNNEVYGGMYGITFANLFAEYADGFIDVDNLYMEDMEGGAIRFFNWIDGGLEVRINNCEINDFRTVSTSEWWSAIDIYSQSSITFSSGGFDLENIKVYDRGQTLGTNKIVWIQSSSRNFSNINCSVVTNMEDGQIITSGSNLSHVAIKLTSSSIPIISDNGTNSDINFLQTHGDEENTLSSDYTVQGVDVDKILGTATGDFDLDGNEDLAIMYNDNGVKIRLVKSNDDGSITTTLSNWWTRSLTASNIIGIVSGDFNSNNTDDIALIYRYSPTAIKIYRINGNASSSSALFLMPITIGIDPDNMIDVIGGDFNGDHLDDIALIFNNNGHPQINLIKSTATGSTTYETNWWSSTTWSPSSIIKCVPGDFNNDGQDDIAVLYKYSGYSGFYVHVLYGQSTNYIFKWADHRDNDTLSYSNVIDAVPGDFNYDGYDDIAIIYDDGYQTKVHLITSDENSNTSLSAGYVSNWSSLSSINPGSIAFVNSMLVTDSYSGVPKRSNDNQTVRSIPENYHLTQNYPNPFNPTTKISYSIPQPGFVSLKVYNTLGQEVSTLVSEFKRPGNYEASFNASQLASGVYFYKIQAGTFAEVKKMLLLK